MLIQTAKELKEAVRTAEKSKFVAVDVETTGLDLIDSEVIGLGLATKEGEWYIDFPMFITYETPPYGNSTDESDTLDVLWDLLYGLLNVNHHILISHNTPFDLEFINREMQVHCANEPSFFQVCLNWWDTLSMVALVDENLIGVKVPLLDVDGVARSVGSLSLKALSNIFLGRQQRLWDENFEAWSTVEKAEYGCADVRNTYDLAIVFSNYLKEEGLLDYYQKYVAPMSFVTARMETAGIKVDTAKLLEVQTKVQAEIQEHLKACVDIMPPQETLVLDSSNWDGTKSELQDELLPLAQGKKEFLTANGRVSTARGKLLELYRLTGDAPLWKKLIRLALEPSNPNSYQQLGAYLASKGYRLPVTQAGNTSVSAEVLENVAASYPDEPIWGPLFKMRKLEKLQGTYIQSLLELAWEDDSVHPEWNQSGTATGRYSTSVSSENKKLRHKRGPALQTIPRPDTMEESGWPYNPREWFIARPGCVLCVSDLSQAEVRMLAVMSQDPALIEAIRSGEDIHKENAIKVYKEKWDKADAAHQKLMRSNVKQVTFGTMYGIGPSALSERLKMAYEEAVALLDGFYDTFSGVLDWKQRETRQLMRYGFVESLLGRRRTPVLIQNPPRVTARPRTQEYDQQKLRELLWQEEYDFACKKSGFDSENAEEQELVARATRQAINFEIQGSVAELINYGLWRLVKAGYRVVGQIHDEVLIEIEDAPEVRSNLESLLREVYEIELRGVPFVLDVHFGETWAVGKE